MIIITTVIINLECQWKCQVYSDACILVKGTLIVLNTQKIVNKMKNEKLII